MELTRLLAIIAATAVTTAVLLNAFESSPTPATGFRAETGAPQPSETPVDKGSKVTPQESLALIAGAPPSPARTKETIRQLSDWAGSAPRAALAWAEEKIVGSDRIPALNSAIRRWAKAAPTDAAAWVAAMPDDAAATEATIALASEWAAADGPAATAWLQRAPSSHRNPLAYEEAAKSWASYAPDQATSWGAAHFESAGTTLPFQHAIGRWAQSDPPAAIRSLEALPDDLRFFGHANIGLNWALTDPAAASEWAANIEASADRVTTTGQVYNAWSRYEPEAAARSLGLIPDEHARTEAARYVAGNWVASDAASASEWIHGLGRGQVRDEAIAEFSLALFNDDPQLALSWTTEIGDASTRNERTETLLYDWLLNDEAAAVTWLRDAPIPPEMKDDLLSMAAETF